MGLSGSSPAQDRHRGFMEVLNSRIKVKEIFGKWKPETVEKEIAEMDSLEEVDVVFAHNDVMAMAARRAIERMHPGLADRISFVGIDAVSGRGSGWKPSCTESWPLRSCIRRVGALLSVWPCRY